MNGVPSILIKDGKMMLEELRKAKKSQINDR
ncbi:hypothetical protein ABET41_12500 [Metabacillus fastidiosus]